jgi:anti-sigma regulatory factor (Ser/Thr protein kinase)
LSEESPEVREGFRCKWACTIYVWSYTPKLGLSLQLARKMVACAAKHAGADDTTAGEIELAVGEALNNAHLHAYRRGIGPLEIEMMVDGPRFAVTVRDHGTPTVLPVIPRERPVERRYGGHGLFLIGQLMDDASVDQSMENDSGTVIRMVKTLFHDPGLGLFGKAEARVEHGDLTRSWYNYSG